MCFRDSIDKKLLESLCSTQTDADIFEDEIAESANWDYTRSFLINVRLIDFIVQLTQIHFSFLRCGTINRVKFKFLSIFNFHPAPFDDSVFLQLTQKLWFQVTQPCNEMLSVCIWNSAQMSCQDLFNAQLTDEGLCCTFNVVHREKMFRNPWVNDFMTYKLTRQT